MASFQERETKPFKGIRMRKWGRWVSEIRIPGSRTRIWLGSYDSPDKAARAYDAALFCLHGARGRFNFPDETRPAFSDEQRRMLSKADIKAIAALFASSSPGNDPMPLPQPGNDPLPLPPPGNDPLPPPPAIPAPPPPIADGTWPELAAGQDGSSLDPFLDVVYGSPMTYNLDEFLLREASAPGTWGFPSVHG